MKHFHGLILVDKPKGLTSHDVVAQIRKKLNRKDVGHSGTLDPMATGLMVTLLGEATKLSSYITETSKRYKVEVQLGVATDSGDITGTITTQEEVVPGFDRGQIDLALKKVTGRFSWAVPALSAIKVHGEKLYEKARRGEDFVPPLKDMEFWDLSDFSYTNNRIELSLTCSKGSYVRTWGEQLGRELGVPATLSALRRLSSADFLVEDSVLLDDLGQSFRGFIPMTEALTKATKIFVSGLDEKLILNGQLSKDLKAKLISLVHISDSKPKLFQILQKGGACRLMGLISFEPGRGFQVRRIFRYDS